MVVYTIVSLMFVICQLELVVYQIFYGFALLATGALMVTCKPTIGLIVIIILQVVAIYLLEKELHVWIMAFVQLGMLFLVGEVAKYQ